MNNTLTCTNVSDRQGRSWHRFILSHPRKDRDRQRLIDSSVCFAKHLSFRHVGPAFLWNTKRRKKLFIIPDGFISRYRIEETSSSGRKLSTTAQLSQTRLMEINDGIQLATRINQSNSTWLWVLSCCCCCCCTIHNISPAKEDTHIHNILIFVPKMKSRANSVLYRVI